MKTLLAILLFSVVSTTSVWLTDFEKACNTAAQDQKMIILNFSGSDWCGPCIRMKTEIFGSEAFTQYASDNLILVRADFPRQKKNQLDKAQIKHNELLADKYNPEGKFPLTLLLDSKGNVLKSWDGLPNLSPEAFVNEIKAIQNAGK